MRRALLAPLIVLAFVGCGSGEPESSAEESCIITFSGQKLCGNDGRAWCEKFANRLDADTRSACRGVGASSGQEVDASDPGMIALTVSDDIDERFPELQASGDFVDGRYEVTLSDFDGVRVPNRKLQKICRIAADSANVRPAKVAVMDVNSPADYVSCTKVLGGS